MRVIGIVILLGLIGVRCCPAADDALPRIESARPGVNLHFRNRCWTPLTVVIVNDGPDRHATLVAEIRGNFSQQVTTFTLPVWLPAHARRRCELPILPDLDPAQASLSAGAPTIGAVKLTDGEARVFDETEIIGRPLPEESYFVLIADNRFANYKFLNSLTLGPSKRIVARAVAAPDDLPQRALELSGVNALVLGDLGPNGLLASQVVAIHEWVRAGGLLIVVPGPASVTSPAAAPGPAQQRSTVAPHPLAAFLPVTFFSAFPIATLPELRRWGPSVEFANGLLFTRLIQRDGETWLGDADRPLIAARADGLGHVVTLAFDTGDEQWQLWPGAAEFWRDLLSQQPLFFHDADRLLERAEPVAPLLANLAGVKVLSRQAVGIYLALAGVALIGILYGFGRTRAPEWGWAVAALVALAGAVTTVLAARHWQAQPQPALNEIYVAATTSGSDHALIQASLGLYSPHDAHFDLTAANDFVPMRPGRNEQVAIEQFPFAFTDQLRIAGLRVHAHDIRGFNGQSAIALDHAAQARVTFDENGMSVALANPTSERWEDGFVKFQRFVHPLGDVAAGATLEKHGLGGEKNTTTEPSFSAHAIPSPEDALRSQLRAIFFPDALLAAAPTFKVDEWMLRRQLSATWNQPALYAWSRQPRFPLTTTEPTLTRRAVGLWAIAAPAQFTGPRLLLPKGVMTLQLRNQSALMQESGEGRFVGNRPVEVLAEFILPPGCPKLRVDAATVFVQFRGSAFRAKVRLAPAGAIGAGEQPNDGWPRLAGGPAFVVAEPGRFYNPGTRSYLVAITIEADASSASESGLKQWQIRELDLQLRGTVQ